MLARRKFLEDSSDDSESEDAGSSSSFNFLTDDQLSEIQECNIKPDGEGTFSAEAMNLAISQNEANLVRLEEDQAQRKYQDYQVKKDKIDAFLSKPIWKRSGDPSEEVLLLEIEALRRSSKKTKITMFKHNSKTGGKVMFGPWWNYALQRIVQISSDNTGDDLDWESYTAGRILLSLFAFVTESNDVVKKGKLADLKSAFGVDWDNNVKTARKVISNYAKDSILDNECTKCELHVDSLRGPLPSKNDQEPVVAVPRSISLQTTHSDNGDKKKQDDDEKKRRDDEARKKRMAAMKESQRRASAFSVSIEQSRAKTEVVSSNAINPLTSSSVVDPHSQTMAPQNDASDQMKPPPVQFIPPVQPVANGDPGAQHFHTAANTSTLYSNTPDDKKIETANTNISYVSQNDFSHVQSHEPHQLSAPRGTYNQASSNDGTIPQTPCEDDVNDRLYISKRDSREDRNRYNDRSSDYGRKRDATYEQSYSRGDSREYDTSRSYGRGIDCNNERPNKRFHGPNDEQRPMNYVSSTPNGRGNEKWQSQLETKSSKYDNTGPVGGDAFTAPTAGGGRGRGRGGVDNRPAWMSQGQSFSNGSAASAPFGGMQQAADQGAAFTAPVAIGRGRGRGGVDNRPAWITQGPGKNRDIASGVDKQQASTVSVGEVAFSAPPPTTGEGRGRGRGGVDNRPAWMTKGQNTHMNDTTPPLGGAAPSGGGGFGPHPADGGMGRGRGRGRGRGIDNRPAWMSRSVD